ncbi:MAG: peptide chain release factor 2 [Elusimicrobiota bacterium]
MLVKEQEEKLKAIKETLDKLRRHLEVGKKIEEIARLEQETHRLDFWANNEEAQKVMQKISQLQGALNLWQIKQKEYEDLQLLWELAKESADSSVNKEIEEGLVKLENALSGIVFRVRLAGEYDRNNAIVTLHSGAGGTEACDWAEMLLRMYQRWTEKKGFSLQITDVLPGEEAGIKSVTFLVIGEYAYGYLQSEIGVHRLVRISPFDANKRRHTSFASCDVIPEITDDVPIRIEDKDLRVDTYRASGHGGQYLNKTDSAVRMTHLPTGIVVQCQNERSQYKNRMMSLKMLRAKLFELEQEKKRAAIEKHYDDKGDIAWGSQIRSYVFMPYQLVKDHRTNYETGDVSRVMDGDLDAFIYAYLEKRIIKKN